VRELLLAALIAWTHLPAATLDPWAGAMADVCTGERECLTLAAQAFVEGGFSAPVLSGECNDAAWRAQQRGWWRHACDGGLAHGPWQLHDARAAHASPELQASVALETMRRHPRAWTTWRQARAQAEWWMSVRGR
jgi:hypothetical protein